MRRPAHAIRTSVLTMLALLAGVLAVFAPSATASSYSTSSYASRLLSLVNATRADHGLGALRLADGTTAVAAAWTAHMADAQLLAHNPDIRHQLETHGSPDWGTYGENVGHGYAADPDSLFHAYMQSPEHRANILTGAYRYVGVAVTFSGKVAWNTFDFVDTYGVPTQERQPAHHTTVRHHATARHQTAPTQPRPRPASSPAPKPTATTAAAPGDRAAAAHHADTRRHVAAQRNRHHAAAEHRVRVQGLRASNPRFEPTSQIIAADTSAVSPLAPLPAQRSSRVVLIAVAVLAFVAAARRWTLTVARV